MGSGLPATVARAPSALGGMRSPLAPTRSGNGPGPEPQVRHRSPCTGRRSRERPASPGHKASRPCDVVPSTSSRADQRVSDNTRRAHGPNRGIRPPQGWRMSTLVPRHGSPGLPDAHLQQCGPAEVDLALRCGPRRATAGPGRGTDPGASRWHRPSVKAPRRSLRWASRGDGPFLASNGWSDGRTSGRASTGLPGAEERSTRARWPVWHHHLPDASDRTGRRAGRPDLQDRRRDEVGEEISLALRCPARAGPVGGPVPDARSRRRPRRCRRRNPAMDERVAKEVVTPLRRESR